MIQNQYVSKDGICPSLKQQDSYASVHPFLTLALLGQLVGEPVKAGNTLKF
jgi:hypothetical protein